MAVDEPWLLIAMIGAAIAVYGWLLPRGDDAPASRDDSFERLLEDLEAENRGLLDAITRLKSEQDETVERLGRRIRELEQEVDSLKERSRAAAAATPADASFGSVPIAGDVSAQAHGSPAAKEPASRTSASSSEGGQASGTAVPAAKDAAGEAAAGEGADAKGTLAIHERYAQLLDLYRRGRSIEQISKALNMNKGEVQLILQLAKREEAARA
ncbi:MAG: hypothetical protein BAA02_07015 [Paenibacillaceae bacterium ZCTH02-B3]|nr:MAG: hypothetical protein BAA02_07015 [Paenibacillaceae bacterium ZCTH02-B3]